jgi:hypothetical protein
MKSITACCLTVWRELGQVKCFVEYLGLTAVTDFSFALEYAIKSLQENQDEFKLNDTY